MPATNFDQVVALSGFVGPSIGPVQDTVTVVAGDGTINAASAEVHLTKASAAAITVTAPTVTVDDGKTLTVISETAFAHVLTCSTNGFNDKGSSGTATFAAAKGNAIVLRARNGRWWSVSNIGVTIA